MAQRIENIHSRPFLIGGKPQLSPSRFLTPSALIVGVLRALPDWARRAASSMADSRRPVYSRTGDHPR